MAYNYITVNDIQKEFSPFKYVMCFSLAMVSMMVGLAFLNGPGVYIKKLFVEKQLVASFVLITSILLSLWFSMIMGCCFSGRYVIFVK